MVAMQWSSDVIPLLDKNFINIFWAYTFIAGFKYNMVFPVYSDKDPRDK